MTILMVFLASCYEPISNTAENTPRDDPGGYTESQSASTPDMEKETKENGPSETGEDLNVGPVAGGFRNNVEANLKRRGLEMSSVVNESDPVERRVLSEYGAVFLTTAMPPSKVLFPSEPEVEAFQARAGSESAVIGGAKVELQPEALAALKEAIAEASAKGLSITPRDGEEASKRSFSKTLELWNSRFLKACDHWVSKGRLSKDDASRLKGLPIGKQVGEVLELEKRGIYFNTFFNNTILSSVAAPGTSQHISMLAFDASEFKDPAVREIMARHGWFRTVQNDEPHFTYLGRKESDLKAFGLKKVTANGGQYWVPDI